jgi:hypothetical protein
LRAPSFHPPQEPAAFAIWGTYPLAISTRRTWALQSDAILEARQTAPCSIRIGTALTNRHPPC